MYENETYTGNNTADSSVSPYFDYTARPAGEAPQGGGSAGGKKHKKAKEPRQKTGAFRKVMLSIGLGLCFGLFAGLGFYAVQMGTGQLSRTDAGNVIEEQSPDLEKLMQDYMQEHLQDYMQDYANLTLSGNQATYAYGNYSSVVKKVMPAMVSIINNYVVTGTSFWGQTYTQPGVSTGSGIIVGETDDELLIVTNNHVVEDATELEVTFIDESRAKAVVKGTDADMDLAVIAVPVSSLTAETRKAIYIAELGDSDSLEMGEPVIAIGNALGYGQSVTNGIVSALDREVELEDGTKGTFIQTNAAINPGNSGGALLNVRGEVVGINSNKIGGEAIDSMGFAIPISAASPIIAELMERQTRDKVAENEMGYVGVSTQSVQSVTDEIEQMFGMPKGLYIRSIEAGTPLEAAGAKVGDIIVKFDGRRISSFNDLYGAVQYYRAGEKVTVAVKRPSDNGYETVELELTLGKRPAD